MQVSLGDQLRAALNQWDREEVQRAPAYQKTSPFQVTNNLNRTAFSEIQTNPGTRKDVTDRLLKQGFKIGSVSAVIGHMLRQGTAQRDDEGVLHVTTPHYVPLKSYKTLRNMAAKKAQAKKKVTQIRVDVRKRKLQEIEEKRPVSSSVGGIAALSPAPAPVFVPAAVAPEQFVLHALESMSVLQARAVYDELKKIFGESK